MRTLRVFTVLLLTACGARTGLLEDVPPIDAGTSAVDASLDLPVDHPDDLPVDHPDDLPVDLVPFRCTLDSQCADAIPCTRGRCDLASGRCLHDPDDRLCPISHRCDPVRNCIARALAVTDTQLFEVELPTAVLRPIGPVRPFTDVALHPGRTLYAVTSAGQLWLLNADDGTSVFDASLGRPLNCLDAAPDGTLYAAGATGIYRVNRGSASLDLVATFPDNMIASGDIAFLQGRLLATATLGTERADTLIEFDPVEGRSRVIGPTGYRCVWALAAFGPTLYGMTCEGYVLTLDTSTGEAREIARRPVRFYGATAR